MKVAKVTAVERSILSRSPAAMRIEAPGYRTRDDRRTGFVNLLALLCVLLGVTFLLRCAWLGLTPLVVASAGFSLLWAATPLMHRFGLVAAVTWLWAVTGIAEWTYVAIAGTDLSVHYFLLAAPALLVIALGPKRRFLAALYLIVYLALFFAIEFWMPPRTGYMHLPGSLTTFFFTYSILMPALVNFAAALYAFARAETAEDAFEAEHRRSEQLLQNLVPSPIALRLKRAPNEIIADDVPAATVLFADIANFTPRASALSAKEVVTFLNRVFSEFDALSERYGLEKIKTIGDAYMVAGGLPEPQEDHALLIAELALDMLAALSRLSAEFGEEVSVRIGIHSGPVIAGVIGHRKLFYDVWGDTVNTAARMESHGLPGKIHVTDSVKSAIGDSYVFEERGPIRIKGKGEMLCYFLLGRAGSDV